MRISDWSSDVCSSDLLVQVAFGVASEHDHTHSQDQRVDRRPQLVRAVLNCRVRRRRSVFSGDLQEPVEDNLTDRCTVAQGARQVRDRKSVVQGKGVSVRGAAGGGRVIKKKKKK